jgi:hypothetical protein
MAMWKKDLILAAIAAPVRSSQRNPILGRFATLGLSLGHINVEHCEIASYGSPRDWRFSLALGDRHPFFKKHTKKRNTPVNVFLRCSVGQSDCGFSCSMARAGLSPVFP